MQAKRRNLFFLNRKSLVVNGFRVIGATLWSHVPVAAMPHVEAGVNDYHRIWRQPLPSFGGKPGPKALIDALETNRWHSLDRTFIERELNTARVEKRRALVLTHHAPLTQGTADAQYEVPSNLRRSAFATDLDSVFQSNDIALWAFGHTHFCTNRVHRNARLVSNQYGYHRPGGRVPEYRPNFVVHL